MTYVPAVQVRTSLASEETVKLYAGKWDAKICIGNRMGASKIKD